MFEFAEAGSVAVALTGAVLGWSLRPVFLRHRRAVVVAAAVLAAAGAAAYDAFDRAPAPEPRVQAVERSLAPPAPASSLPSATPASSGEAWADYLDRAGRDAFAEGDYQAASRYWLDASRLSPRHAASLADAAAHANALAADRL
jgi:hypothetical protein